ncbi:MAG: ATP-binding protein [Chloroflexi bacterium]|nr:ATP-binding protein [Chloroflexota bacterium]MYD49211.1 ATP-binding protein [Chloroflexota bacterium]
MRFFVKNRREPTPSSDEYPFVVLNNDNWDDYHFKTMFHPVIHAKPGLTVELPEVKILKRDQGYGRTEISRVFDSLDNTYCSLGQELAYYENLLMLEPNDREQYLTALRDAATDPTIRKDFENEEGFKTSLLRWSSAEHALEAAQSVLAGTEGENGEFTFTFYTTFGDNEISAKFSYCEVQGLPGRINTIIGYNGTGKTQLLANLAQVAGADSHHRDLPDWITTYGRISPLALRFGKVVAISYSAFDTFAIPASPDSQKGFGYTYCGLRRVNDQNSSTGLKEVSEIAEEMATAISRIKMLVRHSALERALRPLREEPSFARAGCVLDVLAEDERWREEFNSLSSGHKISFNIIVQLVAALQQRSLVLIDEPESHLHPPLLAALMKGITNALEAHRSYAVIATHSPVVLQEIASRYARVLSRNGSQNAFEEPEIETFGENIGLLTRHVFNLDNSQSDYVGVLRELASISSLEEIEGLFVRGLSSQARALIMQAHRK